MSRTALAEQIKATPVIILAGGLGTRLSEETHLVPKPMVELRGVPIIVHIMDFYSQFGFSNFYLCGGYKIEVLKNYFINLPQVGKDVEVRFHEDAKSVITTRSKYGNADRSDWNVTILETGLHAMTGARLRKALEFVGQRGATRACVTYGDGLTDANLHEQFAFHMQHKKVGTVLGVHQPTRFGILQYNQDNLVTSFSEKPTLHEEFINGGYFILNLEFQRYLTPQDDSCVLEKKPLEDLARAGELAMFPHSGFWQCMDTVREKNQLEQLLDQGKAPWQTNTRK